MVTTGIDGACILSPYREKETNYLYGEKLSLWEFNLDMTPVERKKNFPDRFFKISLISASKTHRNA